MINTIDYLVTSGNIEAIKALIDQITDSDQNEIFVTNPAIYGFLCKHFHLQPLKKFQPLVQYLPILNFQLKPLIKMAQLKPSSHVQTLVSNFLKQGISQKISPYLLVQQLDFTRARENRMPLYSHPYYYHTLDQNVHNLFLANKVLEAALKAGPLGQIQFNLPKTFVYKANSEIKDTVVSTKQFLTKNQEFTLKRQPIIISHAFNRILKQVASWSFKQTSDVYPDALQLALSTIQNNNEEQIFTVHQFCMTAILVLVELKAELKIEVWRLLLMILSFGKVQSEHKELVFKLIKLSFGDSQIDGYLYRMQKDLIE